MCGHPCTTLPAILVYPADFPLFEYSCLTFCLVLKGFLQILWWFRFTSLLLKINICTVIICTAVLRILIMLYRHGKKVQIPVPKTSSAICSLTEVSRVPLSTLQKKIKMKENMLDLFGEDDSETAYKLGAVCFFSWGRSVWKQRSACHFWTLEARNPDLNVDRGPVLFRCPKALRFKSFRQNKVFFWEALKRGLTDRQRDLWIRHR